MPAPASIAPRFADISGALIEGWRVASSTRLVSALYAGIFALLGLLLMGTLVAAGRSPLVVPAAGAFMLAGPPLMAGFMAISRRARSGERPRLADVAAGFRGAPPAMWVIALVCALLFMVFVTDAVVLYSFMVGVAPVRALELLQPAAPVASFLVWGSIMGAALAAILYAVSAFSVPLIIDGRAGLVGAVTASTKVVLRHAGVSLPWGLLFAVAMLMSIVLLPLVPLALPVLAYASEALYRKVFPPTAGGAV